MEIKVNKTTAGIITRSKIDWCDYTWNPVWGCENNCPYCYARNIARRFGSKVAKNEYNYWLKEYGLNNKNPELLTEGVTQPPIGLGVDNPLT